MSLIARIATSVSAYAVSSSSLESGDCWRTSFSTSMPVIPGIRWSLTTAATGRSLSTWSARISSASAPEVARSTR